MAQKVHKIATSRGTMRHFAGENHHFEGEGDCAVTAATQFDPKPKAAPALW